MTILSDSYATGFDFNESTQYSTPGSGGGVWTNLVAGEENWTHGSADPVASNLTGGATLPSVTFANSVNEMIQGRWRFGLEFTILIIAEVSSFSAVRYLMGSQGPSLNWGMGVNTSGKITFYFQGLGESCPSTNSVTAGVPFVACCSYSPILNKVYAQLNTTPAFEATPAQVNPNIIGYHQAMFGGTRTTYSTATKLAKARIYNRALHHRDNTNLQSAIAAHIASL